MSGVNDMPAVDLKPLDDSGIDNTATFVEVAGTDYGSAVVAFAADGLNLSDIDSTDLATLKVSIDPRRWSPETGWCSEAQ